MGQALLLIELKQFRLLALFIIFFLLPRGGQYHGQQLDYVPQGCQQITLWQQIRLLVYFSLQFFKRASELCYLLLIEDGLAIDQLLHYRHLRLEYLKVDPKLRETRENRNQLRKRLAQVVQLHVSVKLKNIELILIPSRRLLDQENQSSLVISRILMSLMILQLQLSMVILIVSLLFIIGFAYLIYRFIIDPLRRIKAYSHVNGATIIPFVPVAGAFKLADDAFKAYGDQNYEAKRIWQTAKPRIIVFNGLDKCFVALIDPILIQQFFHLQENFVKEEAFLKNRTRLIGKNVAFSEGQQWAKKRKILSSLFHYRYFNNFIAVIVDIVDRQINQIINNSQNSFEVMPTTQLIAGDTVVKTFFGLSFTEKMEDQTLATWISNYLADNTQQQRSLRYFLFGLPILKLGLFAKDRDVNRRITQFRAVAKQAIEKKLQSDDIKGTILEAIKEKGLLQARQGYTMQQLIEQFMGFFAAGVDTTSHHLTMSFYYLGLYPELQEELREQIRSSKILDSIDFKSLSSLKKLDNFIKEVFRHYSFMISVFPRKCLKTVKVADVTITQGDLVMLGWIYQNFNPEYYPNPHTFDPSRWDKVDPKTSPYLFTPFSIGARGCLGQNFALMEIKITLIKFVNMFRMKVREGYKLSLKTDSLYGPAEPMLVQVEKLRQFST